MRAVRTSPSTLVLLGLAGTILFICPQGATARQGAVSHPGAGAIAIPVLYDHCTLTGGLQTDWGPPASSRARRRTSCSIRA